MKATLISVGTEILMGQTMNTNVMFLSQELNKISIDVIYHQTMIEIGRASCRERV